MVTIGLVRELTAEAARQAALGAGAKLVGTFSYRLTEADGRAIAGLAPDILLLAGGTDGGNAEVVSHNARRLAELSLACAVVVACNRDVADDCAEILCDVGSVSHLNGHRAVPAADPFLHHPVLELATRSQATAIATTERSPLTSLGDWQGIPIIPMA